MIGAQSLQQACPGPRVSFSTWGERREVSGFYNGLLWDYLVNVANVNSFSLTILILT